MYVFRCSRYHSVESWNDKTYLNQRRNFGDIFEISRVLLLLSLTPPIILVVSVPSLLMQRKIWSGLRFVFLFRTDKPYGNIEVGISSSHIYCLHAMWNGKVHAFYWRLIFDNLLLCLAYWFFLKFMSYNNSIRSAYQRIISRILLVRWSCDLCFQNVINTFTSKCRSHSVYSQLYWRVFVSVCLRICYCNYLFSNMFYILSNKFWPLMSLEVLLLLLLVLLLALLLCEHMWCLQ